MTSAWQQEEISNLGVLGNHLLVGPQPVPIGWVSTCCFFVLFFIV